MATRWAALGEDPGWLGLPWQARHKALQQHDPAFAALPVEAQVEIARGYDAIAERAQHARELHAPHGEHGAHGEGQPEGGAATPGAELRAADPGRIFDRPEAVPREAGLGGAELRRADPSLGPGFGSAASREIGALAPRPAEGAEVAGGLAPVFDAASALVSLNMLPILSQIRGITEAATPEGMAAGLVRGVGPMGQFAEHVKLQQAARSIAEDIGFIPAQGVQPVFGTAKRAQEWATRVTRGWEERAGAQVEATARRTTGALEEAGLSHGTADLAAKATETIIGIPGFMLALAPYTAAYGPVAGFALFNAVATEDKSPKGIALAGISGAAFGAGMKAVGRMGNAEWLKMLSDRYGEGFAAAVMKSRPLAAAGVAASSQVFDMSLRQLVDAVEYGAHNPEAFGRSDALTGAGVAAIESMKRDGVLAFPHREDGSIDWPTLGSSAIAFAILEARHARGRRPPTPSERQAEALALMSLHPDPVMRLAALRMYRVSQNAPLLALRMETPEQYAVGKLLAEAAGRFPDATKSQTEAMLREAATGSGPFGSKWPLWLEEGRKEIERATRELNTAVGGENPPVSAEADSRNGAAAMLRAQLLRERMPQAEAEAAVQAAMAGTGAYVHDFDALKRFTSKTGGRPKPLDVLDDFDFKNVAPSSRPMPKVWEVEYEEAAKLGIIPTGQTPILRPAINVDGAVYVGRAGWLHGDVMQHYGLARHRWSDSFWRRSGSRPDNDFDFGFVTPDGEWVSRMAAGRMVWTEENIRQKMQANQRRYHTPTSFWLAAEDYAPWLHSRYENAVEAAINAGERVPDMVKNQLMGYGGRTHSGVGNPGMSPQPSSSPSSPSGPSWERSSYQPPSSWEHARGRLIVQLQAEGVAYFDAVQRANDAMLNAYEPGFAPSMAKHQSEISADTSRIREIRSFEKAWEKQRLDDFMGLKHEDIPNLPPIAKMLVNEIRRVHPSWNPIDAEIEAMRAWQGTGPFADEAKMMREVLKERSVKHWPRSWEELKRLAAGEPASSSIPPDKRQTRLLFPERASAAERGVGFRSSDKMTDTIFVSPNEKENLLLSEAVRALRGKRHQRIASIASEVLGQYGGRFQNAIGDWVDGAENTLVLQGGWSHDRAVRIAAELGIAGSQKSVLIFERKPGGSDKLYTIEIPGGSRTPSQRDTARVVAALDEAGIKYRTIETDDGGYIANRVFVLDTDGSLAGAVQQAATKLGARAIRFQSGEAQFLGAETRTEARKVFREAATLAGTKWTGHLGEGPGRLYPDIPIQRELAQHAAKAVGQTPYGAGHRERWRVLHPDSWAPEHTTTLGGHRQYAMQRAIEAEARRLGIDAYNTAAAARGGHSRHEMLVLRRLVYDAERGVGDPEMVKRVQAITRAGRAFEDLDPVTKVLTERALDKARGADPYFTASTGSEMFRRFNDFEGVRYGLSAEVLGVDPALHARVSREMAKNLEAEFQKIGGRPQPWEIEALDFIIKDAPRIMLGSVELLEKLRKDGGASLSGSGGVRARRVWETAKMRGTTIAVADREVSRQAIEDAKRAGVSSDPISVARRVQHAKNGSGPYADAWREAAVVDPFIKALRTGKIDPKKLKGHAKATYELWQAWGPREGERPKLSHAEYVQHALTLPKRWRRLALAMAGEDPNLKAYQGFPRLAPALRTKAGKVYVGREGQLHSDVAIANGFYYPGGPAKQFADMQKGFVDLEDSKQRFLTRTQAEAVMQRRTGRNIFGDAYAVEMARRDLGLGTKVKRYERPASAFDLITKDITERYAEDQRKYGTQLPLEGIPQGNSLARWVSVTKASDGELVLPVSKARVADDPYQAFDTGLKYLDPRDTVALLRHFKDRLNDTGAHNSSLAQEAVDGYVFTIDDPASPAKPGGSPMIRTGGVVVVSRDLRDVTVYKDRESFIAGANVEALQDAIDSRINKDFWDNPAPVYHGSPTSRGSGIREYGGLVTAHEKRGMGNRYIEDAVWTTTEWDTAAAYGSRIFKVDVPAMKRDGYEVRVGGEPDYLESEARGILASLVSPSGYFADSYRANYETVDADPGTFIFYGNIPGKYLSVVSGEDLKLLRAKAKPKVTKGEVDAVQRAINAEETLARAKPTPESAADAVAASNPAAERVLEDFGRRAKQLRLNLGTPKQIGPLTGSLVGPRFAHGAARMLQPYVLENMTPERVAEILAPVVSELKARHPVAFEQIAANQRAILARRGAAKKIVPAALDLLFTGKVELPPPGSPLGVRLWDSYFSGNLAIAREKEMRHKTAMGRGFPRIAPGYTGSQMEALGVKFGPPPEAVQGLTAAREGEIRLHPKLMGDSRRARRRHVVFHELTHWVTNDVFSKQEQNALWEHIARATEGTSGTESQSRALNAFLLDRYQTVAAGPWEALAELYAEHGGPNRPSWITPELNTALDKVEAVLRVHRREYERAGLKPPSYPLPAKWKPPVEGGGPPAPLMTYVAFREWWDIAQRWWERRHGAEAVAQARVAAENAALKIGPARAEGEQDVAARNAAYAQGERPPLPERGIPGAVRPRPEGAVAPAHVFNTDLFGDRVRAVADAILHAHGGRTYEKKRGGVLRDVAGGERAGRYLEEHEATIRSIIGKPKAGRIVPEDAVRALRMLEEGATQELSSAAYALGEARRAGNGVQAAAITAHMEEIEHGLGQIVLADLLTGTETGRALRARRFGQTWEKRYAARVLRMVMENTSLNESQRERITDQIVKANGDPARIREIVTEGYVRPWSTLLGEATVEVGTMFKLMNPPTLLLRNPVGNAIGMAMKGLHDATGTAIDATWAKVTGRGGLDRQHPLSLVGEIAALPLGIREGVKQAWRALTDEDFALRTGRISAETYRMPAVPGLAGAALRFPGRVLSAEDVFFYEIGLQTDLHRLAWNRAINEGFRGRDRTDRVSQLVEEANRIPYPTREALVRDPETARSGSEQIMAESHRRALYYTYRTPLGPVGARINQIRFTPGAAGVMARLQVPFFSTPLNIAKVAWQNAPVLSMVSPRNLGELVKGTPHERAEAMSRIVVGNLAGLALLSLAQSGYITGPGPDDKSARDMLEVGVGWKPYSVRVGDTYYSLRGFSPASEIIAAAGEWAEAQREGRPLDSNTLLRMGIAMMRRHMDQPFIMGTADVLDAVRGDDEDSLRKSTKIARNFAVGMTIPRGLYFLARGLDPVRRASPETLTEAVVQNLPWTRAESVPFRDPLGRTHESPNAWLQAWVPFSKAETKSDLDAFLFERANDPLFDPMVRYPSRSYYGRRLDQVEWDKLLERRGFHLIPALTDFMHGVREAEGRGETVPNSLIRDGVDKIEAAMMERTRLEVLPGMELERLGLPKDSAHLGAAIAILKNDDLGRLYTGTHREKDDDHKRRMIGLMVDAAQNPEGEGAREIGRGLTERGFAPQ